MDKSLPAVIAAALAALVVLPLLGFACLLGGGGSSPVCPSVTASLATMTPASPGIAATTNWDDEQLTNAKAIVAVGSRLDVPVRGQVIALATAMQESSLRNVDSGDRDSVGLFQQRPSAGWGTPSQLHDPAYAAERFYRALLAVPDWQSMSLTDAAQAVQHSAHPLGYADDEAPANALLATLSGATTRPAECALLDLASALPSFNPAAPPNDKIAQVVAWALLQVGTPYSYGGDCTDPHSNDPARQCDCASLTQRAYLQAGIALPRTAAAQSRTGTPVDPSAIQPGDLLFSAGADGTATEPGHVTMALGNGWIIEAPHTGLTVRVVQLTPARAAEIIKVRRIVA